MTETTELIQRIIEGIQEKKGHDIVHINLNNLEYASATSFVIGTGNTKIQVEAIADSVREYVQEKTGQKPFNYDGYQNSQWIVIDYGTVFAHIFLPEERERYNLEELWADADIKRIPNLDWHNIFHYLGTSHHGAPANLTKETTKNEEQHFRQ